MKKLKLESSEPSLVCTSPLPAPPQGDSSNMRRISRHLWGATLVSAEGAELCFYIKVPRAKVVQWKNRISRLYYDLHMSAVAYMPKIHMNGHKQHHHMHMHTQTCTLKCMNRSSCKTKSHLQLNLPQGWLTDSNSS